MNEKRVIKEWTAKAPSWDKIIEHYRARPGRIEWLANRFPVLRGEVPDTPEPTEAITREAAE